MDESNEWTGFSIFSPRKEWPRLLSELDIFFNAGPGSGLTELRIIEFNYLYGSNIRVFGLPVTGQRAALARHLQTLLQDTLGMQVMPALHPKIPTGNTTALAIRVLLSDVIMAAFQHEAVDDEALFTMVICLYLTLLKKDKTAMALMLTDTDPVGFMEDPVKNRKQLEAEYARNKGLLCEMKNDIFRNSETNRPDWLQEWITGYEAITGSMPAGSLPAIYRTTVYLIMKQLGPAGPLMLQAEYFIRKIAASETVSL
ncbi:hypothetical protein [Longitalea luteola]|uniref:hypothetical protein n=1 Tax=Longitalea luteola TaxID=2812563 RepID=UPI001A95C8C9|nr:hypothetical protein [Longitalea luteola]